MNNGNAKRSQNQLSKYISAGILTALMLTILVMGQIQAPQPTQADSELTASFGNMPADHNGGNFTFDLTFSENVSAGYARIRDDAFTIDGGDIKSARRKTQGSNQSWTVEVDPGGNEAVSITLPETTNCGITGAICSKAGKKKLSNSRSATVTGPPAISVSDATVQEAQGAVLEFSVTLSHASSRTITVSYATQDGTATAGSDYTAASGALTFNPGQTAQTLEIAVLTNSGEEGQESMTLSLSNPSQATLADAAGAGAITTGTQDDPPAGDPTAEPLTASFQNMPATHDGNEFTFQLDFSENVDAGYAKIRDHAFTISGGDIHKASRITQGSNQGWNVSVDPGGNDPISITLPETTDCETNRAICTTDGKKLSNSATFNITLVETTEEETTEQETTEEETTDTDSITIESTPAETPIYYVNPGPGPLHGFSIVDTSNQKTVRSFNKHTTVALDDPAGGSYTIRAGHAGGVFIQSIHMELTGPRNHTATQNSNPFSLFGKSGLTLEGNSLPLGSYTIRATAHSLPDRAGHTFGIFETTFTVVQASETEEEETVQEQKAEYQAEEFDCSGAKTVCMKAQSNTVSEGDPVNLTIRLSEPHDSGLSLTYMMYYPDGAIDTDGFSNIDTSGTQASATRKVTFPAGSTVQTLSIPTAEDEETNPDKVQYFLATMIAPYPWEESPSLGISLKYVDDDLPPGSPTNFRAISRPYHVELNWDPPANAGQIGFTHYEVGIDYGYPIGPPGNKQRYWSDSVGMREFASYYKPGWDRYTYFVVAANRHGKSAPVTVSGITYGAPWEPEIVASPHDRMISVSVNLQECGVPNQLASEFEVQWKSGDEEYHASRQVSLTQDPTTGAGFVRIEIEGLNNNTEYTVRARTINEFGRGPWSDEAGYAHIAKAIPGATTHSVTYIDPAHWRMSFSVE